MWGRGVTAVITQPYLSIGGVVIPRDNLPPIDAVTVQYEAVTQEDTLLSGFRVGQVSPAGQSAATISIATDDPYLLADHATARALEAAVRPGEIVTLVESFSQPGASRIWTNCEVLTASVVARRILPGRTGARYSYAFSLRWRKAAR